MLRTLGQRPSRCSRAATGVAALALLVGASPALAQSAVPPPSPFPFPTAEPESVGMSSAGLRDAMAAVQRWVDEDEIVGAAVAVIRGGKLVLHQAVGWNDRGARRPMRVDDIFQTRSMTKPLTATAILMLVEEGRLALEDPVARHLPAFDTPELREITLLQVLSHTSGFTGGISLTEHPTLTAAVAAAAAAGPEHEPGTRYHYTDMGTSTLGAVVETLTGMPIDRFYRERIFAPLGMHESFCPTGTHHPRASRVAARYQREDGAWVRYSETGQLEGWPFCRASGGVYSTLGDWARFMTAMLHGGAFAGARLLDPGTVALATQPHSSYVYTHEERRAMSRFYGLHWAVETDRFGAHPGPMSPRAFGHGGSDGTYAWVDPDHDLVVLYFTQSRRHGVREQFPALIYEALLRP
jgi:CubicO group peptidase (beta-lactamase class C family)